MDSSRKACAMVLLAAGQGSRFGGVKQLRPVGPNGETLLEYAVRDAVAAGVRKLVFVIRRELLEAFQAGPGSRLEPLRQQWDLTVEYVFQAPDALPEGYACPPERQKPWGTGQALLACQPVLQEPFLIINADDYYGKTSFEKLVCWLEALPEEAAGRYCLAGFRLGNTLSDHGGVTRGICRMDENGQLLEVRETRGVIKTAEGCAAERDGVSEKLDADCVVSMNMWGLTPDILSHLQQRFRTFLDLHLQDPAAEFLLPEIMDDLLREGCVSVQVLPTEEPWYGMTFQADLPRLRQFFAGE